MLSSSSLVSRAPFAEVCVAGEPVWPRWLGGRQELVCVSLAKPLPRSPGFLGMESGHYSLARLSTPCGNLDHLSTPDRCTTTCIRHVVEVSRQTSPTLSPSAVDAAAVQEAPTCSAGRNLKTVYKTEALLNKTEALSMQRRPELEDSTGHRNSRHGHLHDTATWLYTTEELGRQRE